MRQQEGELVLLGLTERSILKGKQEGHKPKSKTGPPPELCSTTNELFQTRTKDLSLLAFDGGVSEWVGE